MSTMLPLRRLMATLAVVAIAGCTATTVGSTGTPSAAPPSSPRPSTTARPISTPAPTAAAGDTWLLVGRAGEADLEVILDSTLEEQIGVPVGVPGDLWGNVFTATPGPTSTLVQNVVIQPGYGGDGQTIDGRWVLPTIGLDPVPVGLSADRSTLVLIEAGAQHGAAGADRTTTRFAVLDAVLTSRHAPRIIELRGAFDFDALSPDGSILYVAEQIRGPLEGRYQVRAVDTANGRLRDAVIVDKRNLDEQMAGYPIDQERRDDGMVMTLYRGTEYPFVHALSSTDAWAVCIDLPSRGFDDADAASDWGIATVGSSELAINATLGIVVEILMSELAARRAINFEPSAAAPFELAKFGHGDLGPAGRRVAPSPDGTSIYAAGDGGIVQLGVRDLDVQQRYLTGTAIQALAITADGATIFALTRHGGRIARIDAKTGDVDGWVGDGGFDRLLGALPW